MNKQLTGGALLSYGAIFFNIVSGLLYTPWMIRVIGDDQYALYTLALSVINLFLIDFGISSSVSRFLANYYAAGKQEEADRFLGVVYRVFFVISLVVALCLTVFYFCIDAVYMKLTPSEVATFKNLFVIVAVYSVLSFPCITFNGVLMANEKFIAVKACNLGQKVLSVTLIIVFLLGGFGLYSLVLVHVFTNVLFYLLKYLCIKRKTSQKTDFSGMDWGIARQLFGFSAWVTVMSISQRCVFSIMPSVIAALIGSTAVTVFSLAATLEGYVYTFADAINGMFLPRISRIFAGDKADEELPALMERVGRFHVCTLGLLCIGFVCVGRQFVDLWMGPGFESVYICAVLLMIPSMIDVPQQVARTAVLSAGHVKEQALIYSGMAAINLVLSFLLLPQVGIAGAAASVCAAYLFRTGASNMLYHKVLPVKLGRYFRVAYGRWSVVAVVTLLTGLALARWWSPEGWLGLLAQAVVIGGVYVTLMLTLGLKQNERTAMVSFIKRLRK